MNLDELAKLEAAMTHGPWANYYGGNFQVRHGSGMWGQAKRSDDSEADAAGIVSLRNAAPALIAAAKDRDRLAAEVEYRREEYEEVLAAAKVEFREREALERQRDELIALLRESRATVDLVVVENAAKYGNRLMHMQQPAIDLLANIDAALARMEPVERGSKWNLD